MSAAPPIAVLVGTGFIGPVHVGPVCIEVEDCAYEGSLESRQAALRQSARFLRSYLPG